VYEVADFTRRDYAEIERLLHRHADLKIGLADASIIMLATYLRSSASSADRRKIIIRR